MEGHYKGRGDRELARRKHSMVKVTMFITIIITLNLMGISYGYWRDGLTSETTAYTGTTKTDFYGKVKVKDSGGFNESKASLKPDKNSQGMYVKLTGDIEKGRRGKLKLDYKVINNGSIPIEFDAEAFAELNNQLDGIKIHKGPSKKIINPNDHPSDSMILQVNAPEEAGKYKFEIQIPYKQWTGN